MRKIYLDNIRWITVVLVVIHHVIYIFNGVIQHGIIGPFSEHQPQDTYQYIVYPWFMLLLFVVSGMSARYELIKRTEKEFIVSKNEKISCAINNRPSGFRLGSWLLQHADVRCIWFHEQRTGANSFPDNGSQRLRSSVVHSDALAL